MNPKLLKLWKNCKVTIIGRRSESVEAAEIIDFLLLKFTWVILWKKKPDSGIYLGSEKIKLGIVCHCPPYQRENNYISS